MLESRSKINSTDASRCDQDYIEMGVRKKLIALIFFLFMSVVFHWPHFISFKADTNLDFYLHYNWAKEFSETLSMGDPYPRWIYHGHFGLGEPVFLYYSPLYYWLTGLISLAGGTVWNAMHVLEVLASTLLSWLIFRSLAYYVRLPIAFVGGVLSLFNPFFVVVNYKFNGFAWVIGYTFLALLIWSLLNPNNKRSSINVWAAIAIALATLSHTVSALIMLICFSFTCLIPDPIDDHQRILVLNRIKGWLLTVTLGLGLSAIYLVPALGSMNLINSEAWTEKYLPWHYFSFPIYTAYKYGIQWGGLQWPISVFAGAMVVLPIAILIVKRKELQSIAIFYRMAIAGLVALFFSSEISYLIWQMDTPLRKVQYPFRFISIVSIVGIFLICFVLEWSLRSKKKYLSLLLSAFLLFAGIAGAGAWLKATYLDGQYLPSALHFDEYTYHNFQNKFLATGFRGGCSQENIDCIRFSREAGGFKGLDEYTLRTEGADWIEYAKSGLLKECESKQLECVEKGRTRDGRHWHISAAQKSRIRLPQFDFPAWQVFIDGESTIHQTDPTTGLIVVDIPKGTHSVTITWQRLKIEKIGLIVNIVSVVVLLTVFLIKNRKFLSAFK